MIRPQVDGGAGIMLEWAFVLELGGAIVVFGCLTMYLANVFNASTEQ